MTLIRKNKIIVMIILITGAMLLLQSCAGKEQEEAKSMEQIRVEEGVPVKVETLAFQPFVKELSFISKLQGIKEATKGAIIGGKIEKINARVGDAVRKDQVIVEFDITNPGSMYEQAKAAYENSEKTYGRMKALLEAGETSQANYDAVEAKYTVDKRNFETQKQMVHIEAPFSGLVVDIKVNEGDNVNKDAHLFTIAQLDRMRTKVWVSEKEINLLKKGMIAVTEFNGVKYYGKITEISLSADPYKQAFYAQVEFDNPKRELKSGVSLEIKIRVYENPNALIIPRNLVMTDDKGSYVFIASNGKAEKRYVKNGSDSGIYYEISSGLNEGEKIIIQGQALVDDGTKIKVID
jgi:RND family efflux transporter MFP subunit